MLDKIGVKDSYNLVPGLFDHSGFVKSHSPQVEILPTQCHESFQHSHCLTVFVDSEPDIHCAHEHFAQQQQCRPNNVWAVSATSPSIKYQFDTVEDCSMSQDRFLESVYFGRKRNFGKSFISRIQ
jgi:hypothetical protein